MVEINLEEEEVQMILDGLFELSAEIVDGETKGFDKNTIIRTLNKIKQARITDYQLSCIQDNIDLFIDTY